MSTPNEKERRSYDSMESSDAAATDDALSQDELDNVAGGKARPSSSDAAVSGVERLSWDPTERAAGRRKGAKHSP